MTASAAASSAVPVVVVIVMVLCLHHWGAAHSCFQPGFVQFGFGGFLHGHLLGFDRHTVNGLKFHPFVGQDDRGGDFNGYAHLVGYGVNQRFYDTDRTTVLGYFSGGRWFAQDFTTLKQIANFGSGDAVTLANQTPLLWSTGTNFYTGTPDIGLIRGGVGILKATNGSTGYGTLDVLGLKASGAAGANFSGLVTSITVVNGIVTAVS